jgi:hypothetical protein
MSGTAGEGGGLAHKKHLDSENIQAQFRIANAESAFIVYSQDAVMSDGPAQMDARYGQSAARADLFNSHAAASEVVAAQVKLKAEGALDQLPKPIEAQSSAVKKIRARASRTSKQQK